VGRRASAGLAWQGKLCLARLSSRGARSVPFFPSSSRKYWDPSGLLGEEKLHHLFRILIILVDARTPHDTSICANQVGLGHSSPENVLTTQFIKGERKYNSFFTQRRAETVPYVRKIKQDRAKEET